MATVKEMLQKLRAINIANERERKAFISIFIEAIYEVEKRTEDAESKLKLKNNIFVYLYEEFFEIDSEVELKKLSQIINLEKEYCNSQGFDLACREEFEEFIGVDLNINITPKEAVAYLRAMDIDKKKDRQRFIELFILAVSDVEGVESGKPVKFKAAKLKANECKELCDALGEHELERVRQLIAIEEACKLYGLNQKEFKNITDIDLNNEITEEQSRKLILDSSLYQAASYGDLKYVKKLIEDRADVNAKDAVDNTALHIAVYNGHKKIVKYLIQQGADINALNMRGEKPLHMAEKAPKSRKEIAKYLRDNGANLDFPDCFAKGDIKTAEQLWRKGYRLDIYDSHDNNSLQVAMNHGQIEMANWLSKNQTEYTPLQLAVFNNDAVGVAQLLESKANCSVQDKAGNTPLHLAVYANNYKMVDLLLSHGADCTLKNAAGYTPASIAINETKKPLGIKVLVTEEMAASVERVKIYDRIQHEIEYRKKRESFEQKWMVLGSDLSIGEVVDKFLRSYIPKHFTFFYNRSYIKEVNEHLLPGLVNMKNNADNILIYLQNHNVTIYKNTPYGKLASMIRFVCEKLDEQIKTSQQQTDQPAAANFSNIVKSAYS